MKQFIKLMMVGATTFWAASAMAADVNQSFKVEGWSCASCSQKTIAEVKKLEGIKEATANVEAGTLTVSFDDAKVKPEQITESIKKAGYSCKLEKDQKKS